MVKPPKGGKRNNSGAAGAGGAPKVVPVSVVPPTPQQIRNGDVLPKGGVPFSSFMQMSDDQKADVITQALGVSPPIFLDDSGMQRFAYFTGMSDKPQIVTDAQLDTMRGTTLYRTINDAYNPQTDIGYTSRDIAKQISEGDFTMYSDSGGSAHGNAIYFADSYRESSYYGYSNKNPVTMRAKITSGSVIDEHQLTNWYMSALMSRDKLALACRNAGSSAQNLFALANGYDVVHSRTTGYYMVLNRRCLTVSDTVKPTQIGGNKW